MKLTSTAVILVRWKEHWVGFSEFGKYLGTNPYIPNLETRKEVIENAIAQVKKLNGKLHVK